MPIEANVSIIQALAANLRGKAGELESLMREFERAKSYHARSGQQMTPAQKQAALQEAQSVAASVNDAVSELSDAWSSDKPIADKP